MVIMCPLAIKKKKSQMRLGWIDKKRDWSTGNRHIIECRLNNIVKGFYIHVSLYCCKITWCFTH